MTNEEKEVVRENIRKLTEGTLLQLIITYTKASLHVTIGADDLEVKEILCQEARSRGLMR